MKKGIDVSKWQGDINWNQVSSDGVEFAILKVTNKSNNAENSFESNYIGAKSVDMPIDVYNYTYASNIDRIKEDANAVVRVLNGRELGCKIWLDIENELQKGLGVLLIDMDSQANVTYSSGIDKPQKTITDVLGEDCRADEALIHCKYYDLLAADEIGRAHV